MCKVVAATFTTYKTISGELLMKEGLNPQSMRTKPILLALCSLTIGIGSAFASLLLPEAVWVHAIYGSGQSPVICIDTKVQCAQSFEAPCVVVVQLSDGTAAVASTTGILPTYQVGCVTRLGNPVMFTQFSPLSGPDRPLAVLP